MSNMCDGETSSALAADESRTADTSKITNKRRSLIFQRRSISHHIQDNVVDTCSVEPEVVDEPLVEHQTQETPEEKDNFDLKVYIESLRNEREDWRKILNERKSKRRRLTKQELNIGDECDLDLTVLTDSERSFLSSRPNYHQIYRNMNNLVPLAVKIATLNTHINHLNENLLESMEEKIVESTKEIVKLAKV